VSGALRRWRRRGLAARIALGVGVSVIVGLLALDWSVSPQVGYVEGDVATRTVAASHDFRFEDAQLRDADQEAARAAVPPVFAWDVDLATRLADRVDVAFAAGRAALPAGGAKSPQDVASATTAFRDGLLAHVPDDAVRPLVDAGFPDEAARLSRELLLAAMDGFVVGDRAVLGDDGAVLIVERRADGLADHGPVGVDRIVTPSDARQRVSLRLLDAREPTRWAESSATIARALVQGNLERDDRERARRQDGAAAVVPPRSELIRRGQTLVRQGDPVTARHVAQIAAMRDGQTGGRRFQAFVGVSGLVFALLAAVHQLTRATSRGPARMRDLSAGAAILVVTAVLARLMVGLAPPIASLLGTTADAASLELALPVAGGVLLVRLLIGGGRALGFTLAASTVAALVSGGGPIEFAFFATSSAVMASRVSHTRERLAVLRAGLVTGLLNALVAGAVFAVGQASPDAAGVFLGPIPAMAAGLLGGLLSAFVVLGLVPMFETAGFVTEYRLMELANLNHPLLRQLMLRAPGSYHHSVIVGTLAEAGAEAIGANALVAKVAAYFHDIGKALKPAYFVENQNGVNRHQELDPYVSAGIIIGHVTEGGRMAREHGLPQPIVDNIYMHHGTGLLQFFYADARARAADPESVDPNVFRYPGPKPSTREAGVIMLADKVEAATRTLRTPDEGNIRAMITHIVNSVVADGQFTECPLTMQEVHTVAEVFVRVLVAINHQRIEYPQTRAISRAPRSNPPPSVTGHITLELPSLGPSGGVASGPQSSQRPTPTPAPIRATLEDVEGADYESVEHLPTSPAAPRRGH
jgi:putative nucleotidyltransferase with HDIG domain